MSGRLAIMDYGIGGLDLFKRIKHSHPELGIMYFSDSGEIPYGKLSKNRLFIRVNEVINFLKTKGADTVIVACHSASSVACLLNDENVIDLIEHSKNCLDNTYSTKSVGIIGGGRTIRSKKYSSYLKTKGHQVFQRIAQPLSIFIERGETNSPDVNAALLNILKPIKHVDALLLACTHYSVLKEQIKQIMGDTCALIDPILNLFNDILPELDKFSKGTDSIYTTGDAKLMHKVSKEVYDIDLKNIIQIDVDLNIAKI